MARDARLIAADASPLIGLAVAAVFELLQDLYGTVTVTRIVKDEVMARADLPGARELDLAMRAGWIRVAPAPPETWSFVGIDAGEASTIALAQFAPRRKGEPLVLMDDELGRSIASAEGLEVLDTPGVLLAAKRAQLVPKLAPLLERLVRRGFTLAPATHAATLAAAGEREPPKRA